MAKPEYLTKYSIYAQQLADAAIAAARVNHYMVGIIALGNEVTWDRFAEAHTVLIDRENAETRPRQKTIIDRAFLVLEDACKKAHGIKPR